MVELTSPAIKHGDRRLYVRCLQGKALGKWCYYSLVTRKDGMENPEKLKTSSVANQRALKDVNVPKQPTQERKREMLKPGLSERGAVTDQIDLALREKLPPTLNPHSQERTALAKDHEPVLTVKDEKTVLPENSKPVFTVNDASSTKTREPPTCGDGTLPPAGHQKSASLSNTESLIHSARDPVAAREYITSEIEKKKNLLRMADRLPDRGEKIKTQLAHLQQTLEGYNACAPVTDGRVVSVPVIADTRPRQAMTIQPNGRVVITDNQRLPPHVIREMYASSAPDSRLYGGRMTDRRLEHVTSITNEAIEILHKQLESCPPSEEESADPNHLRISLMTHQRQALTWLQWREKQKPGGGILADDMGLGKTLTMISLVMQDKHDRHRGDEDRKAHQPQWLNKTESVAISEGTLIVCPASLVHQWAKEVEARCKRGSLSVIVYHGPTREKSIARLSGADIVITTYNLVQREVQLPAGLKSDKSEQDKPAGDDQVIEGDGPLARIAWRRVILDEAHSIKNARSTTALSVCRLRAHHRWALTGTPIQNDLLDFYALLRYLRCSPFDELQVWKRWVDNKEVSGEKRLSVLIKSLLLRRTKDQKTSTGQPLVPLPEKNIVTHELELGGFERKLYDQLFGKCKNVLVDYLSSKSNDTVTSSQHRAGGVKVKGDTILLMILRLRQCCSHPALTKEALVEEELNGEGVELDLISAMKELGIQDSKTAVPAADGLSEGSVDSHGSCKIKALMSQLEQIKSAAAHAVKFVIVSQWTSMLELVGKALISDGLKYYTIKGDVPAMKRADMVHDFNTNSSSPTVMLVSLRAGGVGLNLIGASHLFILDLHWNPALEQQACDRIYRVGQKYDVVIHKLVCKNTIEERILELQKKKTDLAASVLTGMKSSESKLTLNDLRMLFQLDRPSAKFGGMGFM